ncbi:MAG: hypothetical protein B7Z37_13835 [Verrucomicrobia bacterium 12-59-8]|nr:MAG: hypothetical protein B7Z37_13835 [Verrucomicrobia bacterium 12-59-8]
MSHAPGVISTEPIMAELGGTYSLPRVEIVPRQAPLHASNQPFAADREAALPVELQVVAVPAALPPSLEPSSKVAVTVQDLPAQMEQLRNDIFGIAMNASALNDRLDRLEQRIPTAGQSGIATLRGEIEIWLENHLNAAVEHCMNQIINRTNSTVSHPVN